MISGRDVRRATILLQDGEGRVVAYASGFVRQWSMKSDSSSRRSYEGRVFNMEPVGYSLDFGMEYVEMYEGAPSPATLADLSGPPAPRAEPEVPMPVERVRRFVEDGEEV